MPIAKVTVGKSAYGCLNYVLTKDKAALLDTNCAGDTPAVMAQEFAIAFQPHYRNGAKRHTENYVAHFSIAFASELPRPKLEAIAHRFMALMGFDPVMNQFVLAQHHDTDDCHLHLVENRIRLDGTVVSDSFQQRRTEVAMRTLEEEFDLPKLTNSWEVDVRAPHVAEVRQSRETGKPIPRRVLQESIERCVVGTGTLAELQSKLQQSGVTLNATPRDDGSWALLYQLALEDGKVRTFSATKLGKRYTKRGLVSTFGISFDETEVTAPTVEETGTVLPIVLPVVESEVEPEVESIVSANNANLDGAGFGIETGTVSEPLTSFWQEPPVPATRPSEFVPATGNVPVDDEGLVVATQVELAETLSTSELVERVEETLVDVPVTANLDGAGFGVKPLEAEVAEQQADLESVIAVQQVEAESGSITSPVPDPLVVPVPIPARDEWSDQPTQAESDARTESLQAVLRWTQNHIETLALRAILLGLQNASHQEQWDALAAQAQQRDLSDLRQIETAVTALACQQGYKTKTIVKLLQQSPRVKEALGRHDFRTVKATLTQSVLQVREALRRRQTEVLKQRQQDQRKQR